ncbi:hypothetical protein INR49_032598 [Caranx melampygus]|nr:hypothetical protein INR49_032598 [Caranx melampygus]
MYTDLRDINKLSCRGTSDLILRTLFILHLIRYRLDLHVLLSLRAVQAVFCGHSVQHSVFALCESGLKALALGVLAVKTHVVFVQDEVGPVKGLHC